ncbi:MAG: PPC domain-containing protein [Anaerolineae bacterium]|nr:PPC domain-containing protein [Anaerolineae bacterium]
MFSQYTKWSLRLLVLLFVWVFVSSVWAQDARALTPGAAVSGTLDAASIAQVYTFSGVAGQNVSITATADAGLSLALLLTDSFGNQVAQSLPGDAGTVISAVALPKSDSYYVTVLRSPGAPADSSGAYQVLMEVSSGEFKTPGQFLTATGLQVSVTWNTTADLDIEVRDPVGGSVYWTRPTTLSGGTLSGNVNQGCVATTTNATETVSWRSGAIPTGSYEFLVFYQQGCDDQNPVSFTVNAVVDGTPLDAVSGSALPGQVYIGSFVINDDGTARLGVNGVAPDIGLPAPVDQLTAAAAPITLGRPVQDVITNQQPFKAYTFAAQPNDVVSVSLSANTGSLDAFLLLLDPNGNIVDSNDDDPLNDTRDSAIRNRTLVLGGNYTLVAMRYGAGLGGTEGGFTLTLAGPVSTTVGQTATAPNLPNLPNGSVEVSLLWSTNADLQLLVRDPQGDSVFDDVPIIPGGGRLAANGNVNCTPANGSPVSYIYWPQGRLPAAGTYEVEVQFQNQCNDTTPVVFTVNVVANEQLVSSATVQPLPGERYVTSFSIDLNGNVTAGEGGIFGTVDRPSVDSLDYLSQVSSARVLNPGETVTGSIRLNKKFDVYVFDGRAGDVVTVGMQRISGILDTTLFLVDPNGFQVAQNDDANQDTTDSVITGYTLPEDGRYIIIATHFGTAYGVTAGDYTLTLRLNS